MNYTQAQEEARKYVGMPPETTVEIICKNCKRERKFHTSINEFCLTDEHGFQATKKWEPLESPQERCQNCNREERFHTFSNGYCLGPEFDGYGPNRWQPKPTHIDTTEPKPAPQADGFEEWLQESHPDMHEHCDSWSPAIALMEESWSSAQAPLLQKVAELEEKLRDTKKALELACSNDTWTAADYLKAAKGNDDE